MRMLKEKQGQSFLVGLIMSILFLVIGVGPVLALIFGWCLNIYKFASCDFKEPYKEEIIRAVGIPIVPAGIIIGYMDIDDR